LPAFGPLRPGIGVPVRRRQHRCVVYDQDLLARADYFERPLREKSSPSDKINDLAPPKNRPLRRGRVPFVSSSKKTHWKCKKPRFFRRRRSKIVRGCSQTVRRPAFMITYLPPQGHALGVPKTTGRPFFPLL